MPDPGIQQQPNVHAPKARLMLGPRVALLRGYQNFAATPEGVRPAFEDTGLRRKQALLTSHWTSKLLARRSVLDLGANNAFFAMWALQAGAESATAVDMDQNVVGLVEKARRHVGCQRLRAVHAGVDQWREPADVVLALALIHWLYSCTATFGSLDGVIAWLAGLTRHALVVEWIAPADQAIADFGHLAFNPEVRRGPYTFAAFRTALDRHFERVVDLGFVTATRRLFLAYRHAAEIDLSGPLPLLHDASTLLSSRWLTTCGGLHYWSRVYDLGDAILKQGSFDLAQREAEFLRMLDGPHFPRVLESKQGEGYSTVRLEKIDGETLAQARERLTATPAAMGRFMNACLDILDELQRRGITHRDINADNILLRGNVPVLLDFGWAVRPSRPYITPAPLDQPEHASDICGLGHVFATINGGRYPRLAQVIGLMTQPDPRLRVTDMRVLRQLLVTACELEEGSGL